MKVRDLIQNTVWRPGRDYATTRPLISVLLPTFRRGRDGSFLRAANSILNQSLGNLELIVIDDGSTDGTARQIAELMQADARVSCLTHPENIGLPAISEYEAFIRARGDYIAFGFDDFIFDETALAGLVTFPPTSTRCIVHGYAAWFDHAGNQYFYGRDDIPHQRLRFFNFLANASFLVPRAILEDIGLFDPHIAAARLCDWDLWCRILKKYPIHRAPVFIGTEYGHTRDDSLENTYPLFEEAMQEYFSADRDDLLKPENFPDFDVWNILEHSSAVLAAHILKARQFFRSRSWATGLDPSPERTTMIEPGHATVGIFGDLDRRLASVFDGLPEQDRRKLLFIHPALTDAQLANHVAGCGVVITARRQSDSRSGRVKSICAAVGVPVYAMIDDNRLVACNEIDAPAGSLMEIIARVQPVNVLDWIARLRKLLEHTAHRAVVAEARFDRADADLRDRSIRLAAAEAQLDSRSYRLALRIRRLASGLRTAAAWLHPR